MRRLVKSPRCSEEAFFVSHTPPMSARSPQRPAFKERLKGVSAAILEEVQPASHAVHLDQRAGTLPAHHRSDQGVPSHPSQETEATESQRQYYEGLTGRCTRF